MRTVGIAITQWYLREQLDSMTERAFVRLRPIVGNLEDLVEQSSIGLYNPCLAMKPPNQPSSALSGLSTRQAFWIATTVTIVVFLTGIYTPHFIVDSWSYLELSKTVFTDFYRFNTLRQFENSSPYSNSFPPLWPVLLALVRPVVDLGIYTGYLLNCLICIGLLASLIRLFQTIGFAGWVGAACYLSVLGFSPFLADAMGAKTMPLSLVLLTATLFILNRETLSNKGIAGAGLLMGLACLNRFDALPTACTLGVAFVVRAAQSEPRFRRAIVAAMAYGVTLVAALSPWAVYGIRHFGKPFPSDNVRQVVSAEGGNVLDYHEISPPSDLRQHPQRWIAGLALRKLPKVAFGFYTAALDSALPPFLAVVLVIWGASRLPPIPASAARFTLLALLLIPVILLPAVLAGYPDSRYYSAPVLLIFCMLFVVLISLHPDAWNRRRATLMLLVFALLIGPLIVQSLTPRYGRRLPSLSEARVLMAPTPEMQRLTEAVRRDSNGEAHRLILTSGYIPSVRYGALTGEPISVMPRMRGGNFAAFARDWHVTHVYNRPKGLAANSDPPSADPADLMQTINSPGIELIPLDLPGLYRIRLTSSQPTP